jgi:RNA polymerase sigma factor (sigma-70 family)
LERLLAERLSGFSIGGYSRGMNGQSDQELLRHYALERSESAFTQLLQRHTDFVYSCALRMVLDSHLAKDIAQGVFLALAQNAAQLVTHPMLAGWLHRTTHNLAVKTIRTDVRRRGREAQAVAMSGLLSSDPNASWQEIAPQLDEALAELDEAERDLILLRYFQQKSAREIGQMLAISDETAQRRVSRAVESLRECFKKRGITIGSSALIALIAANSVQVAPAGLIALIGGAVALTGAMAGPTVATHMVLTFTNMKWIASVIAAAMAASTGTYLVQRHEASALGSQNQSLAALQEQLSKERDAALNSARRSDDEIARLRQEQSELLRLRGEVAQLRRQINGQKLTPPEQSGLQPGKVQHAPGTYISKDQMQNAGYATPESAIETITYVMMKGPYEQVAEGLGPEMLAAETRDPAGKEAYERRRSIIAPLFKGMQIVAKKVVSDTRVELKVKQDYDEEMKKQLSPDHPDFFVQPMVKVADQWKIGGSTRAYTPNWDTGGQIEEYPAR